jgi:hypothetical protein
MQPFAAFMAAQTSVGFVLGALLWLRRLRPWITTLLLLAAIELAVLVPLGGVVDVKHALKLAAGFATLANIPTRQRLPIVLAVCGEIALWPITDYVQRSELELAALHLAFFGLLIGVHWRTPPPAPPSKEPSGPANSAAWIDDVAAFAVGTAAATVVCVTVLGRWTNSGDEWADTFQAALFAKLRAYGSVPTCAEAFRSFWVFQFMGRSFAQYTPGWPLFMTPFVAVGVPWLAGPASLGLLAAAISRLGRRAGAGFWPGTDPPAHARAAGRFSVAALLLSSTILINGGSRYPHIFVAAMFAWSVESLFAITTGRLPLRAQWIWGAVLGASASLMVAARPGDGCTLGIGLFLYFVYATVRRGIGWRAIAASTAMFGVIAVLSLVILRLQLGRWFQTGYSLNEVIYPWNKMRWSVPGPAQYKWGLPLATGAYCWWPCSPAVALAGIAALRGHARRMGFVFLFSYAPFIALYVLFGIGRGGDNGLGPRYVLPWVVPMAIGSGVVLTRLWGAAHVRLSDPATLRDGVAAFAGLSAVIYGVARIAPLVYPPTYADQRQHNQLHEALAHATLHQAVVFGGKGLNDTDPMDLTENLPLDLYPNQDVLIAIDRPEDRECVRASYPDRLLYRAVPGSTGELVRIIPY